MLAIIGIDKSCLLRRQTPSWCKCQKWNEIASDQRNEVYKKLSKIVITTCFHVRFWLWLFDKKIVFCDFAILIPCMTSLLETLDDMFKTSCHTPILKYKDFVHIPTVPALRFMILHFMSLFLYQNITAESVLNCALFLHIKSQQNRTVQFP